MASWLDYLVFALTASAFIGAILGVKFVADTISTTVSATKESLKNRGLTISDKGVSIKTSSRYTHEDYVDATQRGFIKAMGASSFATSDNVEGSSDSLARAASANASAGGSSPKLSRSTSRQSVPSIPLSRHNSSVSVNSNGSAGATPSEKEKKKYRFGLRKRENSS